MKKKIAVLMALVVLVCFAATGCTEADQVSSNISKEADNSPKRQNGHDSLGTYRYFCVEK